MSKTVEMSKSYFIENLKFQKYRYVQILYGGSFGYFQNLNILKFKYEKFEKFFF